MAAEEWLLWGQCVSASSCRKVGSAGTMSGVVEDLEVPGACFGARSRSFTYAIKPIAAGDFALPCVFAESMYDPSFKGQSVAGRVVVKRAE
jgi:hypothetical protein